ncbi:hypothetical protein AW736_26325 [Termitidicoccus mucosus]|uniref:Uncharacterized protein n=1 Tax=Termitidicoccus mucosus TaxID=1184151 RepID=A0A178IR65_9BACT|nr:hypothetical protein AW736_26325 [Opitutaceae bacterium TSB47]
MTTLYDIALDHARDAAGVAFPIEIARHHDGPAATRVFIVLAVANVGGKRDVFATLTACHTDPEGAWMETVDARGLLDRVGERSLADGLDALHFESGTPTYINTFDGLTEHASSMFEI